MDCMARPRARNIVEDGPVRRRIPAPSVTLSSRGDQDEPWKSFRNGSRGVLFGTFLNGRAGFGNGLAGTREGVTGRQHRRGREHHDEQQWQRGRALRHISIS